jgi:hypothetical protein
MELDHDNLIGMLTRMKLTAIRDQLDSLLDEAARPTTSTSPLWRASARSARP